MYFFSEVHKIYCDKSKFGLKLRKANFITFFVKLELKLNFLQYYS